MNGSHLHLLSWHLRGAGFLVVFLCLFHAYYAFTVEGTTCIVILGAVKHLLVKGELSKLRMA